MVRKYSVDYFRNCYLFQIGNGHVTPFTFEREGVVDRDVRFAAAVMAAKKIDSFQFLMLLSVDIGSSVRKYVDRFADGGKS